MAYNTSNYVKRVARILEVYHQHKESDKPDTFIVKNIFPKHGINISYSGWMFIKHYTKVKDAVNKQQLSLF